MATAIDEVIPSWAQTLIREVTVLNERLPNHIDYTERNISDHETRLRVIELNTATLTQISEDLKKINERQDKAESRISGLERRLWIAIGGLSVISVAIEVWVGLVNGTLAGK